MFSPTFNHAHLVISNPLLSIFLWTHSVINIQFLGCSVSFLSHQIGLQNGHIVTQSVRKRLKSQNVVVMECATSSFPYDFDG